MTDFFVAHVPKNFRDDFGELVVEGDTHMVCDQLAKISPNLLVRRRKRLDNSYEYIVSEICIDGKERWVMRRDYLDPRLVKDIEYILHVPYEHRYAEAEKLEAKIEADNHEYELDKLYDQFGRPMLTELERCGFIQRPVSYPKRGVTGGRGSLERS